MNHPPHILLEFNQKKFAQDSYAYRMEKEYTRIDLADLLGKDKSTVNSFERGIMPKVDVFYNMCKMMGKEVNDYFKPADL